MDIVSFRTAKLLKVSGINQRRCSWDKYYNSNGDIVGSNSIDRRYFAPLIEDALHYIKHTYDVSIYNVNSDVFMVNTRRNTTTKVASKGEAIFIFLKSRYL